MKSSLRPDLYRAQAMLDEMPRGAVVLDRHGHAWQFGGIYWYHAYGDDSEVSSWELSQSAPITRLQEAA